jgi:multicomponent Na+:H+ antiporter subunit E
VRVPLRLAPGTACDAFCVLTSLMPGTLPAGAESDGTLRVHCLDLAEDVPAQISADEVAFLATLGRNGHG